MHIHPLVRFIFFLAFSFSVLLADTLTLWAIYFGLFVVTTGFDRTIILAVFFPYKTIYPVLSIYADPLFGSVSVVY